MNPTAIEGIHNIQARIEKLLERFPVHSISQAMVIELDELDEELNILMAEMNSVEVNVIDKRDK